MKQTSFYLLAVLFLSWMACKPAADETAVETPMNPFQALVVSHPVKDYHVWKPIFIGHDSVRQAYGISTIGVARGLDDTTLVIVVNKISDLAKAKEFASLPDLKHVMDSAGVSGQPTFDLINVIRNDTSTIPQMERLMVKHHVKDFAAWLKVYDHEGKETRSGFGLVDRALGRGIEDTNMVYVVFAVTDMAKAKARGQSEELKKLMEEAGVDSAPQMVAYKFDMYNE